MHEITSFTNSYSTEKANIDLLVAELLAENRIVAVFNGRSEFGPRALGNRSILAKPNNTYIRDRINHSIKNREWFRPLAPLVRDIDLMEYFVPLNVDAFAMQFVLKVKELYKNVICSAVHIDGTARVQVAKEKDNKFIYDILTNFHELTGLGVLINTSLNSWGEPIVETYQDAWNVFMKTDIDAMVIDKLLVIK